MLWAALGCDGDFCGDGIRGAFVLATGATLFILPASVAALTWSPESRRPRRLALWVLLAASAVNGLIAVLFLALAVRSAGNEPSSVSFFLSLAVPFILMTAGFGRWAASLR
jgi:Kef-type K+ transport system membrane component KefB